MKIAKTCQIASIPQNFKGYLKGAENYNYFGTCLAGEKTANCAKDDHMNKILEFMGYDHDRLDGIFNAFSSAKTNEMNKARLLFGEFKTGLQRHIVWEEEVLFPLFEERNSMKENGPTFVMRSEHKEIKQFLEQIHEKIMNKECDTDQLEKGLLSVLSDHNSKEESILYPWIDESFTDEEIMNALEKMINTLPESYNKCCNSRDSL